MPEAGRTARESGRPPQNRHRLTALNLLAVLAIGVLDAVSPDWIIIGILLVIPIVASSAAEKPISIVLVFSAAAVSLVMATFVSMRSDQSMFLSLPNHVFTLLVLAGSAWVALVLQERRLEAQRARDSALETFETNRVLMSLIAHDLRSPLATALHTLEYAGPKLERPVDREMVMEARGRLRRSLRVIDAFLSIARRERPDRKPETQFITGTQLETILSEEIRAFETEAAARGKRIEFDFSGFGPAAYVLEVQVLRQALTILVDNAIRYALPGPIGIAGTMSAHELALIVEDTGPGLSGGTSGRGGMGLGLELCTALVRRAGGGIEVVRDGPEGTMFVLRLPVRRES